MSGTVIADLAVLGISYQRPIPVNRIAIVAKALVPDLWQPTAAVIEAASRRNLAAGFLHRLCQNKKTAALAITATGTNQVNLLLKHDPGELTQTSTLAMDAVQFCFLDFADIGTKVCVLSRHTARIERRLALFEDRCRQCPHQGRFTRLWMDVERSRLDCMAKILAEVSAESGHSCPGSHEFTKNAE